MSFENWLAFVAAYCIISAIPGPSVLMVAAQALAHGKRAAFLCILGDLAAGGVVIALSLFGVGAILAASGELFQIVKWAGVLYMGYLGYCQIAQARKNAARRTDLPQPSIPQNNSSFAIIRAGFLTGVLNPKAIIFYIAFLSQFLDPGGDPIAQFTILVATSTAIVATVLGGYALIAAQARQAFQSERARRWFGYSGGGFMVTGSLVMATTR